MKNRVKDLIAQGRPAIGHWLSLPCPSVAEILSLSGMDWLLLDAEHSPTGEETFEDMIRAFKDTQVVPLMRVVGNDPFHIKKALDRGAMGVICPLVNTEEEARAAVEACRYPPEGIRGVAGTRASAYGGNLQEYFETWNQEVLTIVQIETREAVLNVEKIAQVPGVDVLFIGPNDLSANLGLFGQYQHPDFVGAVDRVLTAALRADKASGYMAFSPQEVLECVDKGIQFIAAGTDARLLARAAQETYQAIRQGLSERDLP